MLKKFFYVKIQDMDIITNLRGKIIVSSQAMPAEPFYDEKCMMAMMQSVINGGAAGLRVAGKRDVINAKTFNVPVIGLTKPDKLPENWKSVVYITPGIKEVKELIAKLKQNYENIDINIFRSIHNVNLDTVIGYKQDGKSISFLDKYKDK